MINSIETFFNDTNNNIHTELMKSAINEAQKGLELDETPVGCVFVKFDNNLNYEIISRSHNLTNKSQNGINHCEINCINYLSSLDINKNNLILYVTIEPCIMCAYALNLFNIRYVIYGAKNTKFGGNGSLIDIHNLKPNTYLSKGGILEKDCVELLRKFYLIPNLKIDKNKRHRKI